MISISHWGMFPITAPDWINLPTYEGVPYREMTNRQKLSLHFSLGLIDKRFA